MSSQPTEQIYEDPRKMVFIQSRTATDDNLVGEYAAMMRDGVEFDAAQGVIDGDGQIFVYDGLHRGEAAKRAGVLLQIEVRPGAKEEAEWLALSANQKHGLRRTQADKQRVVRSALLHPRGVNLSDREVARHCGVDHKTVGKIRQELEASGEIPQVDKRTVTRGEQVYGQDTGKIGQSAISQADIKAALKDALVNQYNQHKWAQRRAKGMSDQQLRDVISQQWDRGRSSYPLEGIRYEVIGLKNPRIWFGDDVGKIKSAKGQPLQGQKLLQAVREVLDIPYAPEVRYCDFCGEQHKLLAAEAEAESPPSCPVCHSSFRGMWVANPPAHLPGETRDENIEQRHETTYRCQACRAQQGEENAPQKQTTCANCGATEPGGPWYHRDDTWLCAHCSPYANPTNGKQIVEPEPRAQEFECPRCGQEKIVGVNGSRRWCLHCNAEWPTVTDFLAEVEGGLKVHPGQIHTFTDEQLNSLLDGVIGLFIEFRDVHGQSEEQAKFSAVNEAIEGVGVFEVQA